MLNFIDIKYLSLLVMYMCHTPCFYVLSDLKFSPKKTVKILSFYFTFILIYVSLVYNYFGDPSLQFIYYTTVIGSSLLFFWINKGPFAKKLFLFLMYVNFFFLICVTSGSINTYILPTPNTYVEIAIRIGLYFILIFIFFRFIREHFLNICSKVQNDFRDFAFISFIFCVLFSMQITNQVKSLSLNGLNLISIYLVMLLMIVSYVIIFKFINLLSLQCETENIIIRNKFLIDCIKQHEIEEQQERIIRHDIRHHNLIILEYCYKKDYNGLIDYLNQCVKLFS